MRSSQSKEPTVPTPVPPEIGEPRAPHTRPVRGPEALRAVTHPLRVRLYEVLCTDGPATVSMIAGRLGLQVGTLSHHLRVLGRYGFLEEAPELAKDRRERWWRAIPGGIYFDTRDFEEVPGGADLARDVAGAMLLRDFQRVLARFATSGAAGQWANVGCHESGVLRLSATELAQLSADWRNLLANWLARSRAHREALRATKAAGREGDTSGTPDPEEVADIAYIFHAFPLLDAPGQRRPATNDQAAPGAPPKPRRQVSRGSRRSNSRDSEL